MEAVGLLADGVSEAEAAIRDRLQSRVDAIRFN